MTPLFLPVGEHKLVCFGTLIFWSVEINVVDRFCFLVVSFVISILKFLGQGSVLGLGKRLTPAGKVTN